MDNNAQLPVQVNEVAPAGNGNAMEAGDWRSQLQPNSRQRIVSMILERLKRHLPSDEEEGLQELKKIAERFEEKIYTAGTSQSDYLRKISLKMLAMETKSLDSMPNNGGNTSKNPSDSASLDSTAQTGSSIRGGDWQEEGFQKIRSMKEMYFVELNELYQKIAAKQPKNEQLEIEKLKSFKAMLEELLQFLQLDKKNEYQPAHREKIGTWERLIVNILNSNRRCKPVQPMQQGQHSQMLQMPRENQMDP